ncbi:hypothetical protein M2113_001023 [Aurantimicrobium minutum]|uniref:hypothetical protein n=1 Tax=Aurantimicrobium minutum TaxID=708131 RepID=UPI00247382AF|nr:hypothetical protein [Aurantimicrobium minutum]MDH6410049.1 hypothetical protein [Aurantimicrobium minutum]
MIHFSCERARSVDVVDMVQKGEVIEITRTSADYESIHILDAEQAFEFFGYLGLSRTSNISEVQELLDAGRCEEIIRAFEIIGKLAYSRVEADWD